MAESSVIKQNASSGHKLGQLVGDWFQDFFVLPVLEEVASKLDLYLDHRNRQRGARGEKILWRDADGNEVDYDFVMELGGTDSKRGVPVAFFESFWRRGARHAKDKARDDSGKLLPMRAAYPSARFLGIVASGDFTSPARELVLSRQIDLFFIPKKKIIEAFAARGLVIDYDDRSPEPMKAELARQLGANFTEANKKKVATLLRGPIGVADIQGYGGRVRAALSALPQEIRVACRKNSRPETFRTAGEAGIFLSGTAIDFDFSDPLESYTYEITYSDGYEFSREATNLGELKMLNAQIKRLSDHMIKLTRKQGD